MRQIIQSILITLILSAADPALATIATPELLLQERMAADEQTVLVQRQGLADILRFMRSRPDLFPAEKVSRKHMLSREQKEQIWSTWLAFLDRLMALDAISQSYGEYADLQDKGVRKRSFRMAYAAFLARYRFALDFFEMTERDPVFHVVLNERVPELGLAKGTYADLKYHYLHVAIASEFVAHSVIHKRYGDETDSILGKEISEDQAVIWKYGRGKGIKQTVKNGAQIVKDAGFKAVFPIQKGVSDWMGDVKVMRKGKSLISLAQIDAMKNQLMPGDVLLERQEWYLSNIGLPGFWPHAALYIGTRQERLDYFDDPEVTAWVVQQGVADGKFESLLKSREAEAYEKSLMRKEEGHQSRVIEAVGEGVLFTSLEDSAAVDSFAALRPKISKLEKAKAILTAFEYYGRPYDFNFDFLTDDKLVCSELVYKAYEKSSDQVGVAIPTVEMLGRVTLPVNEIVKQFDRRYGTPEQQFEFVIFLDGQERKKSAIEADVKTFRRSWKRPKWHIITQGTRLGVE
jgi:hypothetical protein